MLAPASPSPAFWFALSALCLACSESEGASVGTARPDASALPPKPVEVQPGFFTVQGEPLRLLADGDDLPVRLASQGGYAAFAGARVAGMPPGAVHMTAELIDPTTEQILVSDTRVVKLEPTPDASEKVEPPSEDNSNFLHLVACPNYGERMVHGLEWRLVVRVDDDEYVGAASVNVVPRCTYGSRFWQCLCECQPGYVFGKCGAPH
ncbi:MAG: hypothetical protein IPI67_13690 [Myxococcales bacterium]|nr:hypothetical protein [Myxococcales bacterium]